MKNAPADASAIEVPEAQPVPGAFGDYLALTKPRLNFLVVAGSAVAYYLGATKAIDLAAMAEAVAGTALVAGGAAALNQLYERDTDALMRRTRMRPLPAGRVAPADARVFGTALAVAGLALLAARTNWLATLLALVTLVTYLAIYTPMKRRTPLSTVVGALPGALPALIGWTASHGSIDRGGAALFAILFCWQLPHFMAIAWLYREDYALAGFPMLPVIDPEGRRAGKQAVYWAILLVLASLDPKFSGLAGNVYLGAALVLGAGILWLAVRFANVRNEATARALFLGSITYLPLLWLVMIANRL
jgi:heme o synthase